MWWIENTSVFHFTLPAYVKHKGFLEDLENEVGFFLGPK